MDEGSLVGFHGLEVEALLFFVGSEEAHGGFVGEGPVGVGLVVVEDFLLVGDVVVLVR